MNWKKSSLAILGLDPKEANVLNLLTSPLLLQDLAHLSPLPRTSLAYMLKKMLRLGFVKKVSFGKRYKYYSITSDELYARLQHAQRDMRTETKSAHNEKNNDKHTIKGSKNIIALIEKYMLLYPNERVYGVQPNLSWQAMHTCLGFERVERVNEVIRKTGTIIEAIIEKDAYESFAKMYNDAYKHKKFIQSFGARMADYAFAPKGFLDERIEMWVIKNIVLFIDWHNEIALKIDNIQIVNFITDMFMLVKEHGKKLDHNETIRNLAN